MMLENEFLGNTLYRYLVSGGILVLLLILIKLAAKPLLRRFSDLASKTSTSLDEFIVQILERVGLPALYFLAFYSSLRTLVLPLEVARALDYAGMAFVLYFVVKITIAIIGYGLEVYVVSKRGDDALEKSMQGVMVVINLIAWGTAVIFFMDNLGFKISTVIAGLGIGGVAVALAAQAILKDLFSYFSILFDQPFKVGDFIIIDDYLGTIEYIGIKTTRIRSLGGEMLVLSNSDLTESRLRNYRLMERRRVVFTFGVVYHTALVNLKEIPEIIKGIINSIPDTAFDRSHFASFGDFSLKIEAVYYVIGSDYTKYMDVQQKINLGIKEEFEKRGIEFAYPTQTLMVNKT